MKDSAARGWEYPSYHRRHILAFAAAAHRGRWHRHRAIARRATEIVRTLGERERAVLAFRATCGIDALEAQLAALEAVRIDLLEEAACLPAATVAGLRAKAALALAGSGTWWIEGVAEQEVENVSRLVHSLVADLGITISKPRHEDVAAG